MRGRDKFAMILLLCLLLGCCWESSLSADQGMWLFNQPPRKLLKEKYDFDMTDEWLEHVQKSSIRFNNGGSGSFVSGNGLVITNHHIGASTLQKLSTSKKNYFKDGFYAKSLKEELKCPDLDLNVLESIEDVTERVEGAVKPGMSVAEAVAARKAVITKIINESKKKTGLRSDVVKLYQGGLYHLYRFKTFTDVRLVMAPEVDIAFFGGDTDNFEYPRYCLDICFFRVYQDGKPYHPPHYFRWSSSGAKKGDLVFVSGNPGKTNRLETLSHVLHRRKYTLPYTLNLLRHREALLQQFSAINLENSRIAKRDLFRSANARKAYTGQFYSLLDPVILNEKILSEQKLKSQVQNDPKMRKQFGSAWKEVMEAQQIYSTMEVEYSLIESGHGFYNRYFDLARDLVRLAQEKQKPDEKRLPEYRESRWDSLKLQLLSPAPLSPDLEQAKLTGSLAFMAEYIGGGDPRYLKLLDGKSPEGRAAELVQGTKLGDVEFRKKLVEGGWDVVRKSNDPMIRFAILVDPMARKLRTRYETEVSAPLSQAYAKLAKARFQLYGKSIPPDATFSPRIAFGVVKGYDLQGMKIPYATTIGGAFQRAKELQNREPFVLPDSWQKNKSRLNPKTPFNFVSTADTIGGNSGSPVVNRKGEFVGINFDRNRHGLVRNFIYTDFQARHVSVHSKSILEALRNVYDADALVKELLAVARK